jgi:glycine oxidase
MASRTVWEETAGAGVLEALDPGWDPGIDRRPDVLVVGGGVLGLATAAMCRRRGLGRVVLIERDRLASGASGGAAAAVSPEPHVWTHPPAFVELGRAGLELYRALDAEWGGCFGWRALEWLIVLPFEVPTEAAERAGLRLLGVDEARSVEPELGDLRCVVAVGEQGHLHPLRLAAALASRCGAAATGVEMTGLDVSGGLITRVRTSRGDFFPGAVVLATGLTTGLLAGLEAGLAVGLGPEAGQRTVKGHLGATAPAPFRLRAMLSAPGGLVIQLPDGRLVFGGTLDEGDESPEVREAVVSEMRRELVHVLPRAEGLEVQHAWCCFRPRVADEQPVIDRLPGVRNAWVTIGHFRTGILVAPAAATAVASWIATGERPAEVAAFAASRFSDG